jgi:hypothetical protein
VTYNCQTCDCSTHCWHQWLSFGIGDCEETVGYWDLVG